jgi:hypothetical protein
MIVRNEPKSRKRARYFCTHCGRNEIDARELGCAVDNLETSACPMDFIPGTFRHFLYYKLGIIHP